MRKASMTQPKPPQVIACQRCAVRFERARRGAMPKHCPDCRAIIKRSADRERVATLRAEIEAKRDTLRMILEPMRDHLTDDMILTVEQYIDSLAPDTDGVVPLVEDRMPAGTSSPSGPDEGATSEFEDLRDELEVRRIAAVMHDWHAEHPGWWN